MGLNDREKLSYENICKLAREHARIARAVCFFYQTAPDRVLDGMGKRNSE